MKDKKTEVRRMFDAIAYRYDLLNHLLSAGVDIYWRKKALRLAKPSSQDRLLDVACGTGDFAITARNMGVTDTYGADFSYNMLSLFSKKSSWVRGKTVQMAAEQLPFRGGSFSLITVAFGVRNFYDIPQAFGSFFMALQPGGKAVVLEFGMPKNPLIKSFYRFYFHTILPFVGRLISKDDAAYTYLPESVEAFDRDVDLVALFREAGFSEATRHNLTFGLVQVVIAVKGEHTRSGAAQ